MIYIDTMTNAQFAALCVALVAGAVVIARFSWWAGRKLVNFIWPVEDAHTREMRELDEKFAVKYRDTLNAEQVRELTAERWID